MSSSSRSSLIDTVKGLACATIVAHHLAFYGPMSDAALPLMPDLMAWLSQHGRMAVQVFLVLGGYLAAASLAPTGVARFGSASEQIGRRFVRLAVPYAVALVLAVLASAAVRPFLDHPSVPGEPSPAQLVANALMIQDIVGEEALSAGVWYVGIDFQLFALAALLFSAVRRWPGASVSQAERLGKGLVLGGTAVSLLWLNRQPDLDMWACYFFGAYGLGMLACWTVLSPNARAGLVAIAALGAAALWVEFRERIAVAWVCALLLVLWLRWGQPWLAARWQAAGGDGPKSDAGLHPLQRLGRMSYSVFLVHFPVCLLVNAAFQHAWPDSAAMNLLGMATAFGLSLAAGRLMYLRVERHVPSWTVALRWQAGLVGTGLVVAFAAGRFG
ncbi:acyltransferase [Acidovorax sp. SUPP3334]|uniref:acyltransferase family protein n=1 Tax=Acidovorax sp. SUPP3334 TaxID=2920881 RepID=UPI0023DE563D|nr:acyltransferase [Acidovorax sp. SUPP3334]GKT22999.1 acyltransferase [Acidovorax sp. SUPP3334]